MSVAGQRSQYSEAFQWMNRTSGFLKRSGMNRFRMPSPVQRKKGHGTARVVSGLQTQTQQPTGSMMMMMSTMEWLKRKRSVKDWFAIAVLAVAVTVEFADAAFGLNGLASSTNLAASNLVEIADVIDGVTAAWLCTAERDSALSGASRQRVWKSRPRKRRHPGLKGAIR